MIIIIYKIMQGPRAAEGPVGTTPPSPEEKHHPDVLTDKPASHTLWLGPGP